MRMREDTNKFDPAKNVLTSVARHLCRGMNEAASARKGTSATASSEPPDSPGRPLLRRESSSGISNPYKPKSHEGKSSNVYVRSNGTLQVNDVLEYEDHDRLSYFEWLFFELDTEAKGLLSVDDAILFLTYTAFHLSDAESTHARP